MIHNEFGWVTKHGANIFAQSWIPEGEPKAIICIVHGLGEHSSRYKDVAERLTGAGYGIYTFDHEGHGKSSGKRGHTPDYEAFTSNISKIFTCAKEKFPQKKYFIYGHSMGGNLAINYCLDYRPPLAGAVITSPWLKLVHPPSKWLVEPAKIADKIIPSFTLKSGLKSKDFAASEELSHEHQDDKLNHNRISIRTYLTMHKKGAEALKRANEFPVPLFMAHGGEDKITSSEASQYFAEHVQVENRFVLYKNSYHEIHNDTEKVLFFTEVISWLDNH